MNPRGETKSNPRHRPRKPSGDTHPQTSELGYCVPIPGGGSMMFGADSHPRLAALVPRRKQAPRKPGATPAAPTRRTDP
jgi:hypothetical protein